MGLSCGFVASAYLHSMQKLALEQPASRMRFEATEEGSKGTFGPRCFAKTTLPGGQVITVQLNFSKGERLVRYGDVFEANVLFSALRDKAASYAWQRGIVAVSQAENISFLERQDVFGGVLKARNASIDVLGLFGGEGADVLQALVCGYRTSLSDSSVYTAFKATGLAHIVAVSGAHLVIVCALVGMITRMFRVPRALAIGVQVVIMLGYLVLAAAPPSAIRAALMTAASMSAFFARRRPASLNALGACIVVMIALDPVSSLSVSFALSALSTLGIVVFASLFSAWLEACSPRIPRFARDALSLTFASSIVAQPLSTALFSQLSLVSPLANIVVAPLLPVVCAGGLVGSLVSLVFPEGGMVILGAAVAGADLLCAIVRGCASLPYASIPVTLSLEVAFVLSAAGVIALWIGWPRLHLRVVACLAAALGACFVGAVILAPRFAANEIIMLDVGQGDAFIIRSQGSTVLVDTGNQERLLREALARQGVFQLDAVIVSHADDDHCGSLASLGGSVGIKRVLLANDALNCACDACSKLRVSAHELVGKPSVEGLSVGDVLQVGVFDLTVVWPREFSEEGSNADSVCLLVQADTNTDGVGDWTTLFTGDAEHEELSTLIDSGVLGSVDVLKVGHHGSKNALIPEVAEALSPSIALVSVGAQNRYGHPAEVTLDMLEGVGANVWRSDQAGDVSCKFTSEGIAVKTLR